ncbi:MAG TPA: efflux RND transporter periplasmic adaptor subunit [Bryobacteraceae bacterium]|nr:efflux RND transporter periplasmic adaptor subunit [Bryobacteraceae bacterium]HPT25493.1 efflux RND transporter periplasmic adaptor subunit [Bryobacteraceae bacterium]
MKHRLSFAAILLALAACSKTPETPAPASSAGPAPKLASTVTLDAKALEEARIEIVDASQRSIPVPIPASGRLATNENTTWRVGAVTDGRIISVEVKVGDRVTKGQILARMHSHDIHESRAAYRRAVGEVTRLRSNVEYAKRTRDRTRRLYEMKASSLEQVDMAENALKNEQAALENAQIEESRTRLHLTEFLQIPVNGPPDHEASADPEVHIEDLIPIRSPAAGIILSRSVTPGAVVTASSDMFTVCDLSTIWVMAAFQEEHLSRLRPGMGAHVSVQAYPGRTFNGKLVKIDEKLDPETRTVSARIEIENRSGLLKPEMYATVELDSGGSEPGVFVPQDAVQDVNGQATVFIARSDNEFSPAPVVTGRSYQGLVEISSGLKGGERVVARGSFILKSQFLRASLAEEE